MSKTDQQFRECKVRASSFDADLRTVEVCWAAGGDVKRRAWDTGPYIERLSMNPKHIRSDRMKSGSMSLLDTHDMWSMKQRAGTVLPNTLRFEGNKAFVKVKLSRNELGKSLCEDLKDGMPFPVSVGYKIHGFEESDAKKDNELPIRLITDWEPLEISAVPVPADPGAQSRKETEEGDMPQAELKSKPKKRRVDSEVIRRAERNRIDEIEAIGQRHSMTPEFIRQHQEDGTSREDFLHAALDLRAERDEETATHGRYFEPQTYSGQHSGRAEAMADAFMMRINPNHVPQDSSRQFVNLTIPELARASLQNAGVSTLAFSQNELIGRALHNTSDFPELLGSAIRRTLEGQYVAKPAALKVTAKKANARDFRDIRSVSLSAGPDLEEVAENGEYKYGTFSESVEKYRLKTFGKIFGITRQALINDDLAAFARVPVELGRNAAQFEATYLTSLLVSNPIMGDNKTLFHADHKNLGSAAALNADAVAGARLVMRKQTGLANEIIEVAPRFLVVPAELETTAERIVAEIHPTKTEDVNPFGKSLQVVVESRLTDATAWYLAADPAEIPGLEYSYLEGDTGPSIESEAGFDIDGLKIKVRLDFGAGFMDYRGWYKNPGA